MSRTKSRIAAYGARRRRQSRQRLEQLALARTGARRDYLASYHLRLA
jgi:hypothetical protein